MHIHLHVHGWFLLVLTTHLESEKILNPKLGHPPLNKTQMYVYESETYIYSCMESVVIIWYSGKLSREKIFTNFAVYDRF